MKEQRRRMADLIADKKLHKSNKKGLESPFFFFFLIKWLVCPDQIGPQQLSILISIYPFTMNQPSTLHLLNMYLKTIISWEHPITLSLKIGFKWMCREMQNMFETYKTGSDARHLILFLQNQVSTKTRSRRSLICLLGTNCRTQLLELRSNLNQYANRIAFGVQSMM